MRISNTLDYIEENLDSPLNLKHLAQIACLSPSQFHRIFKKETQRTPSQFIEEIKLNRAYQLLIERDITVNQLSLQLGYNDYETFSRAFKRKYKLSPDDYKSILEKLKEEASGQEGEIFIAPIDTDDEIDIDTKVKEIAESLGITKDQLLVSKTYRIERKSNKTEKSSFLIKNKYTMREDQKIWEFLIKEISE